MREWEETTIGDLTTLITKGTTPPKGKGFIDSGGVNYIKSDAIEYDGTIDKSKFVQIDSATHEKFKRSQIEEDDILFSMAGNYLGKSGIVSKDMLPANTNQALAIIRLDKKKAFPQYIGYCFRQPSMIHYVNNMSAQSAQPNINFQEIASLGINLPSLDEQKQIATILSTLDQKIALLKKQNQTLEELAQTLFKRWFVENIDESWEETSLSNIADIGIGRTPPRKEDEWFTTNKVDVKWISIKDMGECGVYVSNTSEYLTKKAVKKFHIPIIPANTVVLSFKMTLGRVAITTENMLSNEAIAHFKIKDEKIITPEFLYFFLKTYHYQKLGSTSSIVTSINSGMIKEMDILIPDKKAMSRFQFASKAMFNTIKNNSKEIQSLTQLRDTLLPKLMSGNLEIKM